MTHTPINLSPTIHRFTFRFRSYFETQSIVSRAHQTFKDKSYLERYKTLFVATSITSYLLQILSALFALSFAHDLVANLLSRFNESCSLFVSWAIAILILACIEIFKRLCWSSFIVSLVRKKTSQGRLPFSWGALALNALLICIAVYSSTEGAKDFIRKQSDKSDVINNQYEQEAKLRLSAIQSSIESEQSALERFTQSVSWKGKINMSDKNTAFAIASHNRRLEQLQEEKIKTVTKLEAKLQDDLSENVSKTSKDSSDIFLVSLLVELIGLLCIGYIYFFLSKVYTESKQVMECPTPEKSHVRTGTDFVTVSDEFRLPEEDSKITTSLPADTSGFLSKYESVILCLRDGLSNRQTAKRCKVSETTVHNVKRVLRSLGQTEFAS